MGRAAAAAVCTIPIPEIFDSTSADSPTKQAVDDDDETLRLFYTGRGIYLSTDPLFITCNIDRAGVYDRGGII